MRPTCLLLLGVLVPGPDGPRPGAARAPGPEPGAEDVRSPRFEERDSWRLVALDVRMDGVPVPRGLPRATLEAGRVLRARDVRGPGAQGEAAPGEGDGGAPGPSTPLERRYDEASVESRLSVEDAGGSSTYRARGASTLVGCEVAFEPDAAGALVARPPRGKAPAGVPLERLGADLGLEGFLPGSAVAPGTRWEVPPEVLVRLLAPGGDLGLRPTRVDPGDFRTVPTPVVVAALFAPLGHSLGASTPRIEGRAEATLAELFGDVARVSLDLDLRATCDLDERFAAFLEQAVGADAGEDARLTLELAVVGTGRVEWDAALGRARSLQLFLDVDCDAEVAWTEDLGLVDVDVVCELSLSGRSELEARP